jgi:hypothetical protein
MGLETVTNIADLVRTNPTSADAKSQGDDHLRNIKTALLNDFVGFPGAIMVTGTDGGAVNAYTLTPAYGTLVAYGNRMVAVFSPTITNTGASTLNISGLGAKDVKSVDGVALVANDLAVGSIYAAFYNGTEFRLLSITKNYADQLAFQSALPALSLGFLRSDGATAAFTTTHTGYAQNEVKGADIPSAATINLDAATGNLVHVTGTTTITAITLASGAERTVVFDGVLTLTHNATTLILPGNANIVTAAGDSMRVRGDGSGNVRVTSYTVARAQLSLLYHQTADQAITSAGALTLAHGLGRTPILVQAWLKCLTAELGYSVNDLVPMLPMGSGANTGCSVVPDATNLNVRYGSSAVIFQVTHKTTGATSNIVPANWAFFLRVWA